MYIIDGVIIVGNNEVFTFGSNQFAQLGHETLESPGRVLLPGVKDITKVIMVACGDTYSIAITEGAYTSMTECVIISKFDRQKLRSEILELGAI